MDEANISAILAFYNLLAAKIGLEDCQSMMDVRNLMPILANYMKFGAPTFVDDPSFGFRNAIEIIALELDEEFHSQLHSEAAENGDVLEAVKVHLAMIYTFRLLQTEAFSAICEQLEDKHQRHFAYVIQCLDDRHRWTSAPWRKLLHNEQPSQQKEDKDENKENGGERRRLSIAQTPKPNSARMFFPSGNSPIRKVVSSPRGEEVVRIHALEREVKSLREIRDLFGQEKDKAEEICQQKEWENSNLIKTNETLKSRLERVLPVAEHLPYFEGHLISIEEQIGSVAKSLKEAQTTGANAHERVFNLQFELDEMDIKHGELQKEYEKALKRAEDMAKAREETRRDYEKQVAQYKTKAQELRNTMKAQEDEFNRQNHQKAEEISLLQIELQKLKFENESRQSTQCNSLFAEENMLKSLNEMKKAQEEKRTLERELSESKRTMNELLELAEQQKGVIAEFDADRRELEKTQQEMDRMRKHLAERERFFKSEMEQMRKKVAHLQKEFEKALKRAEDMAKAREETRRDYEKQVAQYKTKAQELRNTMKAQEDEFNRQNHQKAEKISLLQIELQKLKFENESRQSTQCNSLFAEENMLKSLNEMKKAQEEKRTLERELSENTLFVFDSTCINDDDRLKELRERNRRYLPHMRSYYMPEAAHLKNSETDLNVMP